MNKTDLKRLEEIEIRTREICISYGSQVADIIFKIVPAERVMEATSYALPDNFSHWTFGRDFERMKTIYNHTGHGVAYEVVFNSRPMEAYLIETNPFVLNAIIIPHCYFHMDMYLANVHCQQQHKHSDMTVESRLAAKRFEQYVIKYGRTKVEEVLDAALSVQMHQNPDLFFEEPSEEDAREFMINREMAEFRKNITVVDGYQKPLTEDEIKDVDIYMEEISKQTPPIPTYNILHYLASQKRVPIEDWIRDILTFVSRQWTYFRSQINTKLLHEGWATYGHRKIFRQLFAEGLVTEEEYGDFIIFDSGVRAENPVSLNPYRVGHALFEHIEERWNKGQFGREFEDCDNVFKRARWDTKAGKGKEKIFEVRQFYNDRMAIEQFFTNDFIRQQNIYLHSEVDTSDGEIKDIIRDIEPDIIREELRRAYTLQGIPQITVENGNHNYGGLYLLHHWSGFDLDPIYRDRVLEKLYYIWQRTIYLETRVHDKIILFSYNSSRKDKDKVKAEILKSL